MSLETKTVVIIGGGSGIGLATALRALAQGARVVIGGRGPDRLEAALVRLGRRASAQPVDTGDVGSLRAFFETVGRFDHLFVPAADYVVGPIDQLDDAAAESPFRSKFWGQYRAAREAMPYIDETGSITLMAGAAGARPIKGAAAYAACNSAIEGLGRALAIELSPVRVNTVSPGTIDGDLWRGRPDAVREAAFASYARLALVGRPGIEEEVADTVLFLMANRFMTGSTLYPDGGYVLA